MAAEQRRTNGVAATGQRVAGNIRRLRTNAHTSTYELARKLEALARPIQPSGISKIEASGRAVDVDDLVALARALGTTPDRLLLAGLDIEQLELTPGFWMPTGEAWQWATEMRGVAGEGPMSEEYEWEDTIVDAGVGTAVATALEAGVPLRALLGYVAVISAPAWRTAVREARRVIREREGGHDGER